MARRTNNLTPAHEGYRYQDLVTAYAFVESLVHRYDAVIVDKKVVEDDRFDDLEIVINQRRTRRQFKSSRKTTRRLEENDFIGKNSSLRIDDLVKSYTRAGDAAADEYRLCATWQVPTATLLSLLESVDAPRTIQGHQAALFKLRAETIWPQDSTPRWAWLGEDKELLRDQFIAFSERFIIELALPLSSETLREPGPLETALISLLGDRVGIGRYPNKGRHAIDVAATAVSLANLARTQAATITPVDIEAELSIRTDYGRVAQQFPLNEAILLDRKTERHTLVEAVLNGEHQLITGPPGAGKSWTLTQLMEDLRAADWLVAYHYCYLEPGDELVERRITIDVLFANLLAELADAEPALRDAAQQPYTAGLNELEAMLAQAAALQRKVVLMVDGVDHIARVLATSRLLADAETDIIDQLAMLRLPPGVVLVVGSQPGVHLDPIREAFGPALREYLIQPWETVDVVALAHRLGAAEACTKHDIQDVASVFTLLAGRSEGNPLYATVLVRELISRLEQGLITDVQEWLQEIPAINGNIAIYYDYLYGHAIKAGQFIADILGVIDFGVSEGELREILPQYLHAYIPKALQDLRPVLDHVSSQGGVRIFHESFRRYITEMLARRGQSVAAILAPVISWLTARSFFRDAKAYRFLLPALWRAERADEALALVSVDFVSTSIAYGHSRDAIQRNLVTAVDIAARELRWPDIVRCVELHRSLHTAFEEKLNQPLLYWETFLDLFGPQAVAERLLFDGKPTQTAEVGLILCSLVDDAGAMPPWQEYLNLWQSAEDQDDGSSWLDETKDWRKRVFVSRYHGYIRVAGFDAMYESIRTFLIEEGEQTPPDDIQSLGERVARSAGVAAAESLLITASDTLPSSAIAPRTVVLFRLGLATFVASTGDAVQAAEIAQRALADTPSPVRALRCVELGASSDDAVTRARNPAAIQLGFEPQTSAEPAKVRAWAASVRLLAGRDQDALDAERVRLTDGGWYCCWLRFVLALAEVEAARRAGQGELTVQDAFMELTQDTKLFVGKPRAVDLYAIRHVIAETLAWGLSLLTTPAEWSSVIDTLRIVVTETGASGPNDVAGPVSLEMLLNMLVPYAAESVAGPLIRAFAEAEVARREAIGTYFETHAEHGMQLARILHITGKQAEAQERWRRVGVYLASYGFRKDTTIYDLTECLPALMSAGQNEAWRALEATQPLAEAVTRHTDGRGTNHAPNAWFRNLITCESATGLALLSRSMSKPFALFDWPMEQAFSAALDVIRDRANPLLVAALYATIPFNVEYGDKSEPLANERFAVITRILDRDREVGRVALQHLAAQVADDSQSSTDAAKTRVIEYAQEQNIALPDLRLPASNGARLPDEPSYREPAARDSEQRAVVTVHLPHFPIPTTSADLVAGVRRAAESWRSSRLIDERFINAFGYRLVELVADGRATDAIRLVRFFARTADSAWDLKMHPMEAIADGLARHGCTEVAAVAYALAYTKSRGGGGYHALGDETHEPLLLRGIGLRRTEALATLAGEVAYLLRETLYHTGITRYLVERAAAWGEPMQAVACWWEAYAVIAHRIPTTDIIGWLERFTPASISEWSIDEGAVALLLGRLNHPILTRKVAALDGFVDALRSEPETVDRPLRAFLTQDTTITGTILTLAALELGERSPYVVTSRLADLLKVYAEGEVWGVRVLARLLLQRAGYAVESRYFTAPSVDAVNITSRQVQALMSVDSGDRLPSLRRWWPLLPDRVVRRLHELITGDVQQERLRQRYQLAYGRDGKARPATPVLRWEVELFETALHEMLNDLPAILWKNGSRSPQVENEVMDLVLPDIAAHLALHASRVVRPPYPDPKYAQPSYHNVVVLADDPLYPGWQRMGYVERQWVDGETTFSAPTDVSTVWAGVVAMPFGWKPRPDDFPFEKADIDDWWREDAPPPTIPPQLPYGRLTGLVRLTDWLGDNFVLIPHSGLRSYISLEPPIPGQPLVWRDAEGAPAVVLRTWRVHNRRPLWAEPIVYEGLDLLMRPDIVARLSSLIGVRLQEVQVVTHQSLPG